MKDEEKAYLYWLHQVPGIGAVRMRRLLDFFGSAKGVYEATEKELLSLLGQRELNSLQKVKADWRVTEAYQEIKEKGIRLVSIQDKNYPLRIKEMYQPPCVLYYTGSLPEEKSLAVAVIGARECSSYGVAMARAFATRLSQEGVNVISGMARGIDGVGQEAAIAAGGNTYAVLGCGVDVCYPASNRKLYEAIPQKGGIISPYLPGTLPQKTLFPYRNQIVAGLSDALLVVEARQKSGTWITVDRALEQGKDVYAVPGRLTDRLSDGCNLLIRQGAGIVLSPEDLLEELKVLKTKQLQPEEPIREEQGLLSQLDFYPKSADDILESIQKQDEEMTMSRLLFELIQLCIQGKATKTGGNYFMRLE